MTDNRRLPINEEGRMDNTVRDGNNIIPRNNNMPAMNTGNVPTHYTGAYRDDYRDIYRGYRYDRRNNKEMNIFKSEENYKPYNDADEIFETIVAHLTKGVKFHDRMMDLYAFLGLYGFKKMHEYQYLSESMERRQTKCYIIDHMNILVEDKCDEKGLDFIPKAWHNYSRQDISPESRQQYIEPSFQGYKQWEEETKELLSYCANELMYMGKMADFNEVMEMIEDVDKELEHLEKLMLKLKSVDYNIEYIMDMQEQLCDKYNEKIEQLFVEKLEEDKIKRKHKTKYSMEEQYQRRSARTGRYIRG